MSPQVSLELKEALTEKLVESLTRPPPESTPRRVHGTISLHGKATAIIGIRRSGKTTFLHQLRGERFKRGTPLGHLPYINFEDERLTGLEAAQLGFLVNEQARQFPSLQGQAITWCFDEIQVVSGWERFVRRLLDTGSEVIVTGSSAALLSREIATALRGRAWEVPFYPFSFAESILHRGQPIPLQIDFIESRERGEIERAFKEWLTTGGFPEAQALDVATRHQLLRDYVDVAMLRDVVERHEVSNVTALRWMVRHLLGNAAAHFSVEKFYATLRSQGIAASKDTLHQLLAYLEDCFLVRTVWIESSSERKRMVNPRKAYPVDPGLIPVFDRSGRTNIGHALETAVLIELERRRFEVTYVRTPEGHEIDFLARAASGEVELFQVCADASDPVIGDRELRALVEAAELYPKARRRLLTLTLDGAPLHTPPGIEVEPAYQWLLNEPDPR